MQSCRSYLMLCFCLFLLFSSSLAQASERDANEAFTVMATAGAAYLNDPAQSPGVISAAALQDNLEFFTVIDIRTESAYLNGHIPGAYHSSLHTLVEDLATSIPSNKPYVIAGYTGQAACQAKIAMELLGYGDVYSLLFGMSAWNLTLDVWTPNCADNLTTIETEDQNGNLTVHSYPELSEDPETVVQDRVQLMLAAGYKGISYANLVENMDQFFIINHFSEADYLGMGSSGVPGHIPGAFQFTPYVSFGLGQMLDNIPMDQPVVVYGWTGQFTTQVVAYLNMLGYDAYNLNYGVNNLFHSELTAHKWTGSAMNDFPLEIGHGTSAAPEMAQPLVTLLSNHPNPFNPSTTISYRLSQPSRASLRIYDLSGRLVRSLVHGQEQTAGSYDFTWHGRNDAGQSVPSGTYLYRLDAGNHQESQRLMLLK